MKKRLQNLLVKAFSLGLAFILVFPTNLFAMGLKNTKSKHYSATSSIMGLSPGDSSSEEKVDQRLLATDVSTEETDKYIIEKYASLSKLAGQIDYKIIVKSKEEKLDGKITTTFAISKNTDLKDLKIEKVTQIHSEDSEEDIKVQEGRPSILYTNDAFDTLAVTTEAADKAIVYKLSAKLTEEALAKIDSKSPIMSLDINVAEKETNVYQDRYTLTINQSETITGDQKTISQNLEEKEEDQSQTKVIYKEANKNLLGENKATITWVDFIHAKDDKQITYDIKVDENQEIKESQIKIEYYGASETGYILKEDYSKTIPFAPSLKLQIPQGYIARLELTTKVKDGTNAKEFSINQRKIPNPLYKEEKVEEGPEKKDNEDPLAKEGQGDDQSSKDLPDDKKDKSSSKESSDKDQSQSPIDLNKEAYINNTNADDKQKIAIDQIASALEAYNKEESKFEELKASVEKTAKDYELSADTTNQIIAALISGLKEEKYLAAKINPADLTEDIENPSEEEDKKISDDEIKALIKDQFAKKNAGELTEDDLESSLANIREENDLDKEAFLNILADLYKNDEIATKNLEEDDLPAIDRQKSKEEVLAEKLAEENLTTEDFIAFLKSYAKAYELTEDELKAILEENKDQVQNLIGDFTIEEIVTAAFLEEINPQVFAGNNPTILDADFSNESFITEIEYRTETLTRATNINNLYEIARANSGENDSSDLYIRNNYVGWKINIPGVDRSGMDISEIKKDKYLYDNMEFAFYAPEDQGLTDYTLVVKDPTTKQIVHQGKMTEVQGSHYVYGFDISKDQLSENGYDIYVVAKAEQKRQNYAIGMRLSPDKNYVKELADNYKEKFEQLKQKYPFLIKWIDTSAANPYKNGINLLDTRMVYLEPEGWQDSFPGNGFRSEDYNDNVRDTDIAKNTLSMFGNTTENGDITWTISETFTAEKLDNKSSIGKDAYSANNGSLGNPTVEILEKSGNSYILKQRIENASIDQLRENIGTNPGTIVNYTFSQKAANPTEDTKISLASGKSATIAYKEKPNPIPKEQTYENNYTIKVRNHPEGKAGYEIAFKKGTNSMFAFLPKDPSQKYRPDDPGIEENGVMVFCMNLGKPNPNQQYRFNHTRNPIEKYTLKGGQGKDQEYGNLIASYANVPGAKTSPLYKGRNEQEFNEALYDHLQRLFWYAQEMVEEYGLSEDDYYKIVQYNVYYYIAGEESARTFRYPGFLDASGRPYDSMPGKQSFYAEELRRRIEAGKGWDAETKKNVDVVLYRHDLTGKFQQTLTGDVRIPEQKGQIEIKKTGEDSKPLAGATFQLLDSNQNPVQTLTSGADGRIKFADLKFGTYYIKEVQGPSGYIFNKDSDPYKVVIDKENRIISIPFTNQKNEIEFKKINESKVPMEGVVFELRRNGRVVYGEERTSDGDGLFGWKGLTPGSYQVVEKDISKYPLYSENQGKTVATFRVDANNNIIDKRVYAYFANGTSNTDIVNKENKPNPIGIEFTKVDAKTSKPLKGAEFILEYKKTGSNIFRELPGSRRVSDGRGKLVWKDLVDGDYRIIETKVPSDPKYQTDLNLGEKASFKITKDAQGYYHIDQTSVKPSDKKIKNIEKPEEPKPETKTGNFELTKEDKETQEKLQGVEFTLTSDAPVGEEGKKFDYKVSKTTDENGKINFEKLYPGTYTLKETKQLPGYQESTKTWTVEVDKQGVTTVKGEGASGYKLEFAGNDTNLRSLNYADIKETLEQNPKKPEGMIYSITIKPKREIYEVVLGFDQWSGFESYALRNNSRIPKSSLPGIGEEKTFTYYISIKDVDTFEKNKAKSPIGTIQLWKDDTGNYENASSKPTVTLKASSGSSTITITNEKEQPKPAKITLRKYDSATNINLSGAEFKLYQSESDARNDRNPIASATTDEHGYASFDSNKIIPNESYYVKEVKAPYGYKINGDGITQVWAHDDDNQIYKDIPNDKNNARFELYKKGNDGKYLSEVKFKLTNQNSGEEETLTTDANGYLSYDKLETSRSYVLEEIKTQDGYVINKNKAIINVDSNGKLKVIGNGLLETEGEDGLTFVVTNTKAPSIDFVKADGVSGKRLPGAQFMLKKDGEDLPDSLTSSDENGRFAFTNLEDGSYTVLETVSPDGYPYLQEPKEVAKFVVKDGIITTKPENKTTDDGEYVVYNKANEIKFKKVDADDKSPLAGAEFDLVHLDDFIVEKVEDHYDPETSTITPIYKTTYDKTKAKHATSDENGSFRWSMARPGKYIVIETKAPNGYKAIPEGGLVVAEFTVDKDTFEIKNIVVNDEFIEDSEAYEGTDHTVTKDINITNKKPGTGQFEINKVDQANTAVSGAKFLLRDIATNSYIKKDGSYTEIISEAWNESDTSGNIKYENLANGIYKLQEYKAPDGYKKSSNTWKVVVNDGTTTITLEDDFDEDINKDVPSPGTDPRLDVTNIKNEIEFTKMTKDTENTLAGAEFEIWWDQQARGIDSSLSADEKYIRYPDANKTYTSGEDGKFKLENLPTGHYKIYETKAPDGHFIEDKPYDNEVISKANGVFVRDFYVDVFGNITIEKNSSQDKKRPDVIYNTPNKGKFRLVKVNSSDRALLGAKFKLIGPNNYENEQITDENGYIEFNDLDIGEYTLEEIEAPVGYVTNEQKWTITVDKDGITTIKAVDSSEETYITYDEIRYLNDENKAILSSKGYIIAEEGKATEDNPEPTSATIKVLNRKVSLPQTGGTGTKIAFALIGTAVMITAVAYFGIFANNKTRKRSRRA